MAKKTKDERAGEGKWVGKSWNERRANNGELAIGEGTDILFGDDPDTAACDTICAVCHALGREGRTVEDIRAVIARAFDMHYAAEYDGEDPDDLTCYGDDED